MIDALEVGLRAVQFVLVILQTWQWKLEQSAVSCLDLAQHVAGSMVSCLDLGKVVAKQTSDLAYKVESPVE